ncbi:hypothetical protein ACEN8I_14790 [Polaromonas sp. CT11-55]|uniref:hypothetical protein n=1 Tax=Polaromonas sp. CT11-55 TaxID=3243045 RepID=UPI0039A629B2
MTDGKYTNPFLAFLILGLMFLGMACSEIYGRASIEADGLIVGREVVCQQPKNNRCATNYLLKRTADNSLYSYSAGPVDQSLSSELGVGASVRKQRWHLKYEVNGKEVDDFPVLFYVSLLAIGFFAIGLWISKTINRPR